MTSTHDARENARILEELAREADYYLENFDALRRRYKNEYVAIHGQHVVFHDRELSAVLADLERGKLDPREVLVEFCPEGSSGLAF